MRWFPVAFLTNGVFIVKHGGVKLITPVLSLCMLNYYTKAMTTTSLTPDLNINNTILHNIR